MSSAFLLWKTAHILSATVLFGTGLGIAFFCWFGYRNALRRGEIAALRAVLRLTVVADAWLTAPAVVFQAVSGWVLMRELGLPLTSPWALASIGLFALVGACWLPVVVIQFRLWREAEASPSIELLSAGFHGRFRIWFALGVPAFAGVIALFYLMVAKPLSLSAG
jgi:uncharacterized membrane protein